MHILEKDLKLPMPKRLIMYSPTFRLPPGKEQMEEMRRKDKLDCIIPSSYIIEQDKVINKVDLQNVGYMKSPIAYSWKGLPEMYVIYGSYEVLISQLSEAKEKLKRMV